MRANAFKLKNSAHFAFTADIHIRRNAIFVQAVVTSYNCQTKSLSITANMK